MIKSHCREALAFYDHSLKVSAIDANFSVRILISELDDKTDSACVRLF